MDFARPISAIVPTLEGSILRVLARTTTALSGSRIASLTTNGSNSGVRLALSRLVRQGVVTESSARPALLYAANRNHILWPAIEQAVRAADGAFDLLAARIAALANERLGPSRGESPTIAVYGSVARRDGSADSDIDLVVVFPTPDLSSRGEELVDELTIRVPEWTGNICNVYPLSQSGLGGLVEAGDPMIDSWRDDAITIVGPDLRSLHPRLASRAERVTARG